jgi:CRISPR type III-B/RAMP module-associated protein Cmr5
MKKVESLLPSAIEAIREQKINDNNEVDNEYKGDIDKFAASIVHNGLLPAVVFNEQNSSDSEKSKSGDDVGNKKNESKSEDHHLRRKKLMRAILQVIKKETVNEKDRLQDYVLDQMKKQRSMDDLRHEVGNAATAVKLGLRTFKFIKKNDVKEQE